MEGSMEPSRRALGVQLAKLAAPMVLSNLAYTLLGVLDTLFLGRVSTAAVGAIGVAGSLFLAFALLFRGLIQGTLPYVARMYGSQRPREAGKYLKHFALLSLLVSPLVALFPGRYNTFPHPPLHPEVAVLAAVYINIRS